VLVFCVAGFGAVTVYTGNPPWATVTHWTLAMTLLAVLATAAIRAGALGGESARSQHVERRTFRSARGAAAIAFIAVVFGGLTAKVPGGAVACRNFPLCGVNPDVAGSSVGIQVTHRLIALFLLLHVIGMLMAGRKRKDSAVVKRAVYVLLGIVLTQGLVAGAMIGMHLPPVVRSMHEAVGVAIWLSAYTLAYLARIAAGMTPLSDGGTAPRGAPLPPRTPMSGAGEQAMAGVSQMARPHSVAVFVARGAGGEA
jgi:heme A synthase